MFSISSHSSRTTMVTRLRSRVPRFRWSMTRPGVPTTTGEPMERARSWGA